MRLNVGVIFGGKSVEHEISILSAVEMMGYFDTDKYNVIPIYIDKNNDWYTGMHLKDIIHYRDISLVKRYAKKVNLVKSGKSTILQSCGFFKRGLYVIDFIFPIGHGAYLEDGSLQGYLNMLGVPYAGPDVLSSAIGIDKVVQKQLLEFNHIPVCKYVYFYDYEFTKNKKSVLEKINILNYPLYVKPATLGSSVGITKVENEKGLVAALNEAIRYDKKVIVEEAVSNVKEVNISVLGNYQKQEVSEIEEINSFDDFYSFKEKYVEGFTKLNENKKKSKPILSKEMLEDMKKYAIQVFKVINALGVARIDFLIDDKNKKIYVNEINTIPGGLSGYLWKAKKKPQGELIEDLITLAVHRYKSELNYVKNFDGNLLEQYDILKGDKINKK